MSLGGLFDEPLHQRVPQLIIPTVVTDTCYICEEQFRNSNEYPVILSCGHVFGAACISKWLEDRTKICPMCRKNPHDSCRVQATSASTEIPAAPFLFDRTNTIQELAAEDNPISRSLTRSLTVTAAWELQIERFNTKNPIKAINAMAACWLLRKSPQENAASLSTSYTRTMRDAYDAIKVALNTTFMKAIKNGLPINPYIAMLFEIPRLRQKASNDNKYDSPDKTAAIIQVAVLQTSKIDLALSDRMKLAEIISGVAFSNFPLQHDGELAQKLDITRSALNDLVVLCDRHKEARGDDIFSTARLNVDALRRAYLVSVESVKQWEPQTPDFMINLFPQESHRGFSLFDSTTTSSKTSTQTSERNTGVPNITVTDTHLSTSSANTTRPRDESAHRNSTATSQSQPAQQPSGGLFGSGSNLFGTSSSGSLFSTPGSTSLFSGGDTSTIPASNTSPFGAATTGASPGRLFATAGSRPTQSRSIFSNLFSSSTTQPSASNNQQTRSSSIFSSGPNLSASASPTPTDPAVIAANQRQTAPQSSTTPAANQHSYRQPFVVDESEDAMDTTPTIATPETSRSSAALQSLTQNVASEASRHEDEDDHWSGLLQRIRDFRAHQQSSGIDDVARRREEHVMTLMGVALDLAESGMA